METLEVTPLKNSNHISTKSEQHVATSRGQLRINRMDVQKNGERVEGFSIIEELTYVSQLVLCFHLAAQNEIHIQEVVT